MTGGMRDSRRLILPVLAVAVAAGLAVNAARPAPAPASGAEVAGARFRLTAPAARRAGAPVLSAAERAATFRFAPGTSPADRDAFLAAVADAQPPARRLVALVDGLVDVRVGATGQPGTLGLTESGGPRYEVTVDLGRVASLYGSRGIDRVVLHELGHVVDHTLVADDVMAGLQTGIPSGYGCDDGRSGACADPAERFAESFAKWATGDIGVDIDLGYRVPPPTSLEHWGDPLAPLLTTPG